MQPVEAGAHWIDHSEFTFKGAAEVCRAYEEDSGLRSADFYTLYRSGTFCSSRVNGLQATRWAVYYRAYLDLRPDPDTAGEGADPAGDLVPEPAQCDATGFPDLVLIRPPRVIFAEMKSEKGRVTEPQREWSSMMYPLRRPSEPAVVADTGPDAHMGDPPRPPGSAYVPIWAV